MLIEAQRSRTTHPGVKSLALAIACSVLLSSCGSGAGSPESRIYRMGERVAAGRLIYNVLETDWHVQLGEGPNPRIPNHRFLLIRLTVTNSGIEESNIPLLALVNARGETFNELSEGEGVPEWLGLLRRIKPAGTEQGRVIFDVPRGPYRLLVKDDTLETEPEKVALIEIPHQFEGQNPQ